MTTKQVHKLGYYPYRQSNGRWSAFDFNSSGDFYGNYRTRKQLLVEIDKHIQQRS